MQDDVHERMRQLTNSAIGWQTQPASTAKRTTPTTGLTHAQKLNPRKEQLSPRKEKPFRQHAKKNPFLGKPYGCLRTSCLGHCRRMAHLLQLIPTSARFKPNA